jgi:putative phosphoribosyl transferase
VSAHDLFQDRWEAAELLASDLIEYDGHHPLILAIPRGAVPMGKIIADRLHGDLDVVLVHKLGAPRNPEYAIGAIDESGWTYLPRRAERWGVTASMIDNEKSLQLDVLKKRRAQYTPFKPPIDPKGRITIIVDDGMATGATMIAALHAIRAKQPSELICAVPVAAQDSVQRVLPLADKVICLSTPTLFFGVSQFYRDFPQVDDDEVIRILTGKDSIGLGARDADQSTHMHPTNK